MHLDFKLTHDYVEKFSSKELCTEEPLKKKRNHFESLQPMSAKSNNKEEEEAIFQKIPPFLKSRFLEVGFAKPAVPLSFAKWWPIVELNPFDAPANVKAHWWQRWRRAHDPRFPNAFVPHLVYFYGMPQDLESEAFGFLPSYAIIRYEDGVGRGLDKLPACIQEKTEKGQTLNTRERQFFWGLQQLKEEYRRPKKDRMKCKNLKSGSNPREAVEIVDLEDGETVEPIPMAVPSSGRDPIVYTESWRKKTLYVNKDGQVFTDIRADSPDSKRKTGPKTPSPRAKRQRWNIYQDFRESFRKVLSKEKMQHEGPIIFEKGSACRGTKVTPDSSKKKGRATMKHLKKVEKGNAVDETKVSVEEKANFAVKKSNPGNEKEEVAQNGAKRKHEPPSDDAPRNKPRAHATPRPPANFTEEHYEFKLSKKFSSVTVVEGGKMTTSTTTKKEVPEQDAEQSHNMLEDDAEEKKVSEREEDKKPTKSLEKNVEGDSRKRSNVGDMSDKGNIGNGQKGASASTDGISKDTKRAALKSGPSVATPSPHKLGTALDCPALFATTAVSTSFSSANFLTNPNDKKDAAKVQTKGDDGRTELFPKKVKTSVQDNHQCVAQEPVECNSKITKGQSNACNDFEDTRKKETEEAHVKPAASQRSGLTNYHKETTAKSTEKSSKKIEKEVRTVQAVTATEVMRGEEALKEKVAFLDKKLEELTCESSAKNESVKEMACKMREFKEYELIKSKLKILEVETSQKILNLEKKLVVAIDECTEEKANKSKLEARTVELSKLQEKAEAQIADFEKKLSKAREECAKKAVQSEEMKGQIEELKRTLELTKSKLKVTEVDTSQKILTLEKQLNQEREKRGATKVHMSAIKANMEEVRSSSEALKARIADLENELSDTRNECESAKEHVSKLKSMQAELGTSKAQVSSLQEKLFAEKDECAAMKARFSKINATATELTRSEKALNTKIADLESKLEEARHECTETKMNVSKMAAKAVELRMSKAKINELQEKLDQARLACEAMQANMSEPDVRKVDSKQASELFEALALAIQKKINAELIVSKAYYMAETGAKVVKTSKTDEYFKSQADNFQKKLIEVLAGISTAKPHIPDSGTITEEILTAKAASLGEQIGEAICEFAANSTNTEGMESTVAKLQKKNDEEKIPRKVHDLERELMDIDQCALKSTGVDELETKSDEVHGTRERKRLPSEGHASATKDHGSKITRLTKSSRQGASQEVEKLTPITLCPRCFSLRSHWNCLLSITLVAMLSFALGRIYRFGSCPNA